MNQNKKLLKLFLKEELNNILQDELESPEYDEIELDDEEENRSGIDSELTKLINNIATYKNPSSINLFLKGVANNLTGEDSLDNSATSIQIKMASILVIYYFLVISTDYKITISEFNRIKNIMLEQLESRQIQDLKTLFDEIDD